MDKMSQILFGQSYYLYFDKKLWQAMQPYPPLGTLYAASYLRTKGYSVALFDAMLANSEAEWAEALERYQPEYAILFEDNFNYLSKMCLLRMRQAAFEMIAMARQRGCTVIVSGADATDHPAAYLAQGADFVLLGEGEETLGELIDRLDNKTSLSFDSILGLAYHTGPDKMDYRINPRRPDIRDLDSLPFPAWDLVDVHRYREIWESRHGTFSMNMATTRGCPYHCNWCAKPIWGQRYQVRSPENVVAEMSVIKESYHPDHLWFVDDIFGLKPGWLEEFARLVQHEHVSIPFKCLNRADLLLREGEIDALKKAGCKTVWIGAESGSQKILDAMEKGTRVDQIRAASQQLRAAGIETGFFLQFGYPGETRQDIEMTFQLVRECQPDDIGMSVSYPLPGTPFYDRVVSQLGEKRNWTDSNDLAMLYHGPYTTEFYRQLYRVLHKEFRSRKTIRRLLTSQTQEKPTLNKLFKLAANLATLPFERWKLEKLARRPHPGNILAEAGLSPESAAQPSPQEQ
ncbi:MAG TPA: radical SAM protein [Anaerolineales bacterium]|nr:radical SAM protein [Anaerolineales bacterium]